MRKFLLLIAALSLLMPADSWAAWSKSAPAGTSAVSDIDAYVGANNTALDLLLAGYRRGAEISYSSASSLSIAAGEVVCANSDGSVRLMARNSSAISTSWNVAANGLDAGAEAASTTYYVFACMDAADSTFTVRITTSSTAPTGITYYRRLGSFYNDSSSNITIINNDDDDKEIGSLTAKTEDVNYCATVDGTIYAIASNPVAGSESSYIIYSDGSATPSSTVAKSYSAYADTITYVSGNYRVRKGDYYRVEGAGTVQLYWQPSQ